MHKVFIDFQNSQIAVRTNMSAIEHFVRESHAPMIVSRATKLIRTIDVMKLDRGYQLGDEVFDAEGDASILHDMLRQMIQREFINAHSEMMWMHSGAVASGDAAILIAGASTAGKSTLVTNLMQKGLSYMTDELVGVSPDAVVTGFPRVPIRRLRADRHLTPLEMGFLGRETIPVNAAAIRKSKTAMHAIVFCQYEHKSRTTLKPLAKGEAALRLIQTLLNFNANKETMLPIVTNIARTVPAYALTFSDASDATRSILNEM